MTVLPEAFIVLGPAGSGKSTVARRLAQAKRAAYLDKDALAGALVRLLLEEHGDDIETRESNAYYRERIMPAEYRTLFDAATANLQLGSPVVLDAPFATFLQRPHFLTDMTLAAGWPPTDIVVVQVRTAPDVIRKRLVSRALPRDRWKLENWDDFWEQFGSPSCVWQGARHMVVPNDDEEPDLRSVLHEADPGRA